VIDADPVPETVTTAVPDQVVPPLGYDAETAAFVALP
jgi:hypothetical protein